MFYKQIESDTFRRKQFLQFSLVFYRQIASHPPPAWPRRDARSVMVLMDTHPTLVDTNGGGGGDAGGGSETL